ncbi:MAG: phytanoyl-CoA dioxygenase family protein [Planctomycetota bacterium]|nr:phytanoyl-CoA dioxygenase family protein [Planctomycetota bacterium]
MNTASCKLSSQQLSFFDTFGFLAFPGLLADRIDEIIDAFEQLWAKQGGGHQGRPHDPTRRSCIVPFVDRSEILSSLLDDPRILGVTTSLLGDDFNYMGSDGNLYAGDTGWHSDGRHREGLHIKLAFYLDPVARDSGCLRVIPGSHRLNDQYEQTLQDKARNSSEHWGIDGPDVPATALETQPGDVVCFNHNTKHAAFGGSGRRRMFTMNCCQRYPEDRLQELRDYMAGGARFWVTRAYGDAMINTASPDRMVHLEQCLANDGHLAELSEKAREKMAEPSRG